MQTVLSESLAKSQTVQIYEQKLLDMERYYQDRMREEVRPLPSLSRMEIDEESW